MLAQHVVVEALLATTTNSASWQFSDSLLEVSERPVGGVRVGRRGGRLRQADFG